MDSWLLFRIVQPSWLHPATDRRHFQLVSIVVDRFLHMGIWYFFIAAGLPIFSSMLLWGGVEASYERYSLIGNANVTTEFRDIVRIRKRLGIVTRTR